MITPRKYQLANIDCADCALKIEEKVRKTEGVNYVSINFASASMYLEADDLEKVRTAIRETEPDVLVLDDQNTLVSEKTPAIEIVSMVVAGILWMVGIFFHDELHNTPLQFAEYAALGTAYLLAGWEVIAKAVRYTLKGTLFDENFLMMAATLGAFAIHEIPEAVGVMLFYKIGETIQEAVLNRSRHSIQSLLAMRPDQATLLRDGKEETVAPETVAVGERIAVRAGERVPLDGKILLGSTALDTSALTGESLPRKAGPGDEVLAGMINLNARLEVEVTARAEESSLARLMNLVDQAAARKAKTEKFITRFARVYTPAVVGLSALLAIVPPLVIPGAVFNDWLYRALVLLVISCPCALMISIPLGYFGGLGALSRAGVLVKGANFIESLANVKTMVFDKTGTLTHGRFSVAEVQPYNGTSKAKLLQTAYLAEQESNHPIAISIRQAITAELEGTLDEYEEVSGLGIRAVVDRKTIFVGNDRLLHEKEIEHHIDACEAEGTVVHVAEDHLYQGYFLIEDEVKENSRETLDRLRMLGVEKLVMLSGDSLTAAKRSAERLHLDEVHGNLLPEDKLTELDRLLAEGPRPLAYVGDGINDAPVLARADVGIAMGALGADAAIETADVVLMTDDLTRLPKAVTISRFTRRVVWQNIGITLLVKMGFIGMAAFGVTSMWLALIADVGVALLAVLNATRVIRAGARV